MRKQPTKKQMEDTFRKVAVTKPVKKLSRDDVPKPDAKNTIRTPYQLLGK